MSPTDLIRVNRQDLLVAAYDRCVLASSGPSLYGLSWYLDCVCDAWYVLINREYTAVMPVPVRQKLGLSYVYLPPMVQQLGVFGESHLDVRPFYQKMLYRHLHVDYVYRPPNVFHLATERQNLVISFDRSLDDLMNGYNSNRKRDLKKSEQHKLSFELVQEVGRQRTIINKCTSDKNEIERLVKLLTVPKTNGAMHLAVVAKDQTPIFFVVFGDDGKRIYYLWPQALDDVAMNTGAATYAITELIKRYHHTHAYFDFEGSMIDGVRKFYSSFGPQQESYFHFRKKLFHFLKHAR